MSYSDDTAAYLFAEYQPHIHDYRFWKADETGWVFACDCGSIETRSDEWLNEEAQRNLRKIKDDGGE